MKVCSKWEAGSFDFFICSLPMVESIHMLQVKHTCNIHHDNPVGDGCCCRDPTASNTWGGTSNASGYCTEDAAQPWLLTASRSQGVSHARTGNKFTHFESTHCHLWHKKNLKMNIFLAFSELKWKVTKDKIKTNFTISICKHYNKKITNNILTDIKQVFNKHVESY